MKKYGEESVYRVSVLIKVGFNRPLYCLAFQSSQDELGE